MTTILFKSNLLSSLATKITPFATFFYRLAKAVVVSTCILGADVSFADNVRLVDKPLVDSTQSDVLPNLMYILDNSGSMLRNFTPDWIVNNYATPTDAAPFFTIGHTRSPEYSMNAVVNTQYYNPSIRYTPAINFDGSSRGEQTTWTSVRNDNFNVQNTITGQLGSTTNLVGNASYFSYVAGEHCASADLRNCVRAVTPSATHPFPAPIRWCSTLAIATSTSNPFNGDCRAVRSDGVIVNDTNNNINLRRYTNIRTPLSRISLTFSTTANTASVSSIKINGIEILPAQANASNSNITNTRNNNMATAVSNAINACTNSFINNNCDMSGHSATVSNNVVTVTSPAGALTMPIQIITNNNASATSTFLSLDRPGSLVYVNINSNQSSYVEPGSTTAAPDRTDCPGATCTYAQEMTNYANWWTYYRTRMQGMKTSTSLAFRPIDNRYRVGFITINSPASNYLPINKFETGNGSQKANWYNILFSNNPNGATPLRESLATVGRIYAGKKPVGSADPVEYACQPNFALLTTDGYWNGNAGRDVNNALIGNLDGTGTPRPLFEGNTASGTLADVAKYYFDTDLRQSISGFANCNGALGQNVCGDGVGNENIRKQNMTTLTLGLGIDGTLLFDPDYKNQTQGDFADIKSGAKNWPVPVADQPSAIDDLWHAAVNSNGTYFSARNPRELSESLRRALADIQSSVGAGSAAAASSLQPTAGDNFDYVASYATVKWIGNLEARTVNLNSLETSSSATWCAEDIASSSCTAPAQLASEDNAFFCRTSNSNIDSCKSLGGSLTGTECRVTVAKSCNGTLKDRITQNSDNRNIFTNSGGSLVSFNFNNLNTTQRQFYQAPFLSNNLSQWPNYTTDQQTKAVGANLVNYLRGQQGFEDRSNNLTIENRIFRAREATLGDITESQPAFVGKPRFNYLDAGYPEFKASLANRSPTVYVGANDGMLHAFNATNGQERWAFVPTPAISKMWKLADKDYATNHVNLVNGDPLIADIFDGSWKTILVAGLSGGGRGYYALDITNPDLPKLLWEKTAIDINNLGYTFGQPVVTKLNGTWVVMFTSGYNNGSKDNDGVTNNSPQGNGGGFLYIVNASNGNLIKTMGTNIGSPTTPSGLAPIAAYVDDLTINNSALFVIGGDLLGNVWKFDITSNNAPVQLATLAGQNGPQPITTIPQLGIVGTTKVAFIGTGKYLEVADLTNTDRQSLYAIKVDGATPLGNPRSQLVQQVISGGGNSRTVTNNNVNFNTSLGWFVDFPAPGERANVDSLLVSGTLLAPTIVPQSTSCSPGGFGYFNFFDYRTGGSLLPGGIVSESTNSPIVGFNVSYTKDGKPVLKIVESNNPTSRIANTKDWAVGGGNKSDYLLAPSCPTCNTFGRKYNWRELIPNQ